jgi:hypothetical protein
MRGSWAEVAATLFTGEHLGVMNDDLEFRHVDVLRPALSSGLISLDGRILDDALLHDLQAT